MQFNPSRLKLARCRRQLTLKALAEKVGLTSRMVSQYEKAYCGSVPPQQTIEAFSLALDYPAEFFFEDKSIEEISPETVSFRSLKSMRAAQQHAAVGAGSLGLMLNDYFEARFNLPVSNLPDLRGVEPEAAAEIVRETWRLGNSSIDNMVHLLELHGVRVFSLAENTQSVDAFSFWKGDTPFVFLNTQKSGERSRFDAAHELGHLVLHKHGVPQGKEAEAEADKFASFFLMPRRTVVAYSRKFFSLDDIIALKGNWKVSAMALIVQLNKVGALSDWQYRTLIVEASKLGLRSKEVNGIEREKSLLIEKILSSLNGSNIGLRDIAEELHLPLEEVTNLLFRVGVLLGSGKSLSLVNSRPTLRLVN